MTAPTHVDAQLRLVAWYGLGIVIAYYLAAGVALRWRIRRGVRVVRYDPPEGISPAVACYLREDGATEKPFVVTMASMAAKGVLHIERGPDDYLTTKLDSTATLEPEEQAVADALFRTRSSVLLKEIFPAQLKLAAGNVRASLESAIEPELISGHFAWLVPGLTLSLWSLLAALYPDFDKIWSEPVGLMIIAAGLGIVAVLGILKTLPAILYKARSYVPGRTPNPLPLARSDLKIIYLLLMALACVSAIAFFTSWTLAWQWGSFLTVNAIAALAFRTPTAEGYRVLDQIADFRAFLADVDADRVNRVNLPDGPSPSADKNWPWALALGIEHSWGEQFAAAVLNRVGLPSAFDAVEQNAPEGQGRDLEIMDLRLNK